MGEENILHCSSYLTFIPSLQNVQKRERKQVLEVCLPCVYISTLYPF